VKGGLCKKSGKNFVSYGTYTELNKILVVRLSDLLHDLLVTRKKGNIASITWFGKTQREAQLPHLKHIDRMQIANCPLQWITWRDKSHTSSFWYFRPLRVHTRGTYYI